MRCRARLGPARPPRPASRRWHGRPRRGVRDPVACLHPASPDRRAAQPSRSPSRSHRGTTVACTPSNSSVPSIARSASTVSARPKVRPPIRSREGARADDLQRQLDRSVAVTAPPRRTSCLRRIVLRSTDAASTRSRTRAPRTAAPAPPALASVGAPAPLVSTARSASRPPSPRRPRRDLPARRRPPGRRRARSRPPADPRRGRCRTRSPGPRPRPCWRSGSRSLADPGLDHHHVAHPHARVQLRPLDPVAEREGERGMG